MKSRVSLKYFVNDCRFLSKNQGVLCSGPIITIEKTTAEILDKPEIHLSEKARCIIVSRANQGVKSCRIFFPVIILSGHNEGGCLVYQYFKNGAVTRKRSLLRFTVQYGEHSLN